MSGTSVQILAQAHAFIEAGNLEDAENLIRSLLEQEPDNTDAWWLLAHSVRDAGAARQALDEVLRLDPNDQQARSLLSALDDRFPSDLPAESGPGLRLSRPRFSRPRMPSLNLPGGLDDYSTPVSYLVLVILLIAGGWLVLRYFGIELNLTTPTAAAPQTEVVRTVVTSATATADPSNPTVGDGTAPSTTGELTPGPATQETGIQAEAVSAESTVEAGVAGDESGALSTPAPISPAPALPDDEEGGTATPAPLPSVTPLPVPTYPYPLQTDPQLFASLYRSAYAEAGLQLAATAPLLEGSQFGSAALASVCLNGSIGLRETINEAMAVMAGFAAQLENSAPALGVKVLDCEKDGRALRIVAAPVQSALEWGEGTLSLLEFQASWEAVA